MIPQSKHVLLRKEFGPSVANMSYRITDDGAGFEYRMVIRTSNAGNTAKLAERLQKMERMRSFRVSPTGD